MIVAAASNRSASVQGCWCFRFHRSADAIALTDCIRKIYNNSTAADFVSGMHYAKSRSQEMPNITTPQRHALSSNGTLGSDHLLKIFHEVLKDPDLPGMTEQMVIRKGGARKFLEPDYAT